MNIIKDNRIKKKMFQKDLALYCGVDRSTVTKWETGQAIPRPDKLVKLSELFNCTIDELVKGEK